LVFFVFLHLLILVYLSLILSLKFHVENWKRYMKGVYHIGYFYCPKNHRYYVSFFVAVVTVYFESGSQCGLDWPRTCYVGWPQTQDPPALPFHVLRL
jgi:hypothetical protein